MSDVSQKGFTLIELLVAIAVIGILSISVLVGYRAATPGLDLKMNASNVVDVMNLARQRTVSSLGSSSYGVHFEGSQFVLFKGTAYNASDPDNIFYALPSALEIADITLAGGGSEAVFDRLTGKTAQSGTVKVRLISDTTQYKIINILSSGQSDISAGALPPGNTRIADTRHVHFNYAQNISSTSFLVLNFPDDAVTQNIDFPTYYSGGVFDWSGTITVNGSPQVLRIHTHSADVLSADFSITRDLRYNDKTKRLEIFLDADNIINYSDTGTEIKGLSALASVPVRQ